MKQIKSVFAVAVAAILSVFRWMMEPIDAYVRKNFVFYAVVEGKSGVITNRDAVPSIISNRVLTGGTIQHARGVCAIANGDSIASKFRFAQVPSNALILAVRVSCPDIGTTATMDVGVYRTSQDGGAVVDADVFGSAVSLSGGALSKSDITTESGVITVVNSEKLLWQHTGLSADPKCMLDVVGTLTAASDAAGSVLVEIDYTV